jgi:gluconate 5-dehydrogenase
VLVARASRSCEAATAAIEKNGGRAAHIVCDLANREQLFDCAEHAAMPFGVPDIVVNAAGINRRLAMQDVTADDWDAVSRSISTRRSSCRSGWRPR